LLYSNSDGGNIREVVVKMIRWRDVVINGLNTIQWRLVGYEVGANNGVSDFDIAIATIRQE